MKKILVPTDFSEQAGYALEVAYHIAKKSDASIVLLHVVEDASVTSMHYTGEVDLPNMEDRLFMMKLIEKGKQDLAELANSSFSDAVIEQELRIGSPYHNIKDIIGEHSVDLVVMGTKGSTGLEEFLIGSNAEKVVRHAKCPVLTIHKKATSFDFKEVVYATALEEEEEQCVNTVKMFQKLYGSTLHLVRINTPNNFQSDRFARPELEAFAKRCQLENYKIHIFNEGSEEEGIIYFAESINADMIAMATHGRTGLAHLLTGSIAEDVVNHAKRPVLTYVIGR
ncbi:universal stress protein [Fulvivirga ulvae]|uniref:universal stress protein n=1 Tax=Fulvivirga ulvae TaxID=2904245 RepID=UPI001F2F585F|nr:universal stress protein [Fulvivirga ulvae]UII29929.1 universal stress protein [Fulvivirga ulvae]